MDMQKAMRQWLDLYNALTPAAMVYLLPPQGELQDLVYTANLGLTLPHTANQIVVLSNFRSAPRAGEEDVGRDFFNLMEFDLVQSPHYFEGFADCKYLRENIYISGWGIRTAPEFAPWLAETFDAQIIPVHMTDPLQYHFDCLFFAVNDKTVMACTELMQPEDAKAIENVATIIDVPKSYAYAGSTNCVKLGTRVYGASGLTEMKADDENYEVEKGRVEWLTKTLAENALDFITINLSEFDKSGAACSCFVLPLHS
jgi:N-dimethylarginine dimethylaminohydrolase